MTEPAFADEARGPWTRPRGIALDVCVVMVTLVVAWAGSALSGVFARDGFHVALVTLEILPLLVRRTHPAWCVGLVTAFSLPQLVLLSTPTWGQAAVPLTIYAAVTYGGSRLGRVALALGLGGAVLGPASWTLRTGDGRTFTEAAVFCALVVVSSWLVGTLGRTRKAYVDQLIERGIRVEREAEQRAELAASQERARIAREMHDIVAHGLSVMVVQADGARLQLERDPERVGRALDTIAGTGRESLQEMRRLLGLLRPEDHATATRPQPGLADLRQLLDEQVQSRIADDLPAVGQGVGLTAYRVVQEALTNVRKHAGPDAHPRVEVWADAGWLHLVVLDDGRGAAAPDDGSGHGLAGMRERVAVHGGTLVTGARPRGGFEVRAALPLTEVPVR
ncbi:sensor histidine kinase [Nocardioides mangrovicus]|uniref:histidine kinase n=1 Tax=Nocardioides mangrovicus TaxID=2478913 RepID=A0A3L8NZP7_9ACTN|nr:sensor histidine kinase [Nocardioides mangrovicus]RLV48251.1 sensor histidine kinase [Nocardioides mangrovicus]